MKASCLHQQRSYPKYYNMHPSHLVREDFVRPGEQIRAQEDYFSPKSVNVLVLYTFYSLIVMIKENDCQKAKL